MTHDESFIDAVERRRRVDRLAAYLAARAVEAGGELSPDMVSFHEEAHRRLMEGEAGT